MKKNIRKILIGLIIFIAGTLITQFIFDVRIYQSIWWFLNINFPLWAVLLIVIFLFIIMKYGKIENISDEPPKPDFFDYNIDKFDEIIYVWEYSNYAGKYEPDNIAAFCPKCKRLLPNMHQCKFCNYLIQTRWSIEEVKIEIYHNLNMKTYKTKLNLSLQNI